MVNCPNTDDEEDNEVEENISPDISNDEDDYSRDKNVEYLLC